MSSKIVLQEAALHSVRLWKNINLFHKNINLQRQTLNQFPFSRLKLHSSFCNTTLNSEAILAANSVQSCFQSDQQLKCKNRRVEDHVGHMVSLLYKQFFNHFNQMWSFLHQLVANISTINHPQQPIREPHISCQKGGVFLGVGPHSLLLKTNFIEWFWWYWIRFMKKTLPGFSLWCPATGQRLNTQFRLISRVQCFNLNSTNKTSHHAMLMSYGVMDCHQ